MNLRFWHRRPKTLPAAPAPDAPSSLKELNCRYCGPIVADPEAHLASPEHRLAQAKALAPGDPAQSPTPPIQPV